MSSVNESWTDLLPPSMRERLHGRVALQRILSNIVWLSMDKLLRLAVGAVVGVWMARFLGPAQFGLLNYSLAFVVLFSPLASLGLESILVRDVLTEDELRQRVSLGTAFALRTAGSLLAAFLACSLLIILRPGEPLALLLVAIAGAGLAAQSFDVIDLWFHSKVKAKFGVYAKTAAFILLSVVRILLLVMGAPLVAFAWAAFGELALGAVGLVVMYRRRGGHIFRWRATIERARRFLLDSWPLAFSNLAVILYMRIGQVMIGNIMADREVGIYSVAVRLAEMWYFIPTSIASSVFPAVLKAKREDPALYAERLRLFYGLMSVISISVAAVTFLFSNVIITTLFGPQFAEAGPVLSVYIWASVPVFLNVATTQFLIAENRTTVALYRTIAGAVANIALNFALIPSFGTLGAAVGSMLAYWITLLSIAVVPDLRGQIVMMIQSLNPSRIFRVFFPRTQE